MLLTSLRERFRIVDIGLLSPFSSEIFVGPVAQRSKSSLKPAKQRISTMRSYVDEKKLTPVVEPHDRPA